MSIKPTLPLVFMPLVGPCHGPKSITVTVLRFLNSGTEVSIVMYGLQKWVSKDAENPLTNLFLIVMAKYMASELSLGR